jgi:hypothetical protein
MSTRNFIDSDQRKGLDVKNKDDTSDAKKEAPLFVDSFFGCVYLDFWPNLTVARIVNYRRSVACAASNPKSS